MVIWRMLLCILLLTNIAAHRDAYGQGTTVPNAGSPPIANWQTVDASKLDAPMCERLRAVPPAACPDGDPGAICRVAKEKADLKCKELLGGSIFDFLPKGSKEKFIEYASLIIFALLGLATTSLIAWINAYKSRAEAKKVNAEVATLENRALDPFFERPVDFDQYATNMILIGEGGSGKTTLLHALSGAPEAQPDVATSQVSTYTIVHEVSIEQKGKTVRRLYRIYSDDYEGQDWVRGAQNEFVKSRQKDIKSSTLVIVVDLFEPPVKTEPVTRREKPQASRIREQLRIYNEPAIQSLAQLLGPDGQVILFINKIDLIYPLTDERVQGVKASYAPLVERLSEIRGARLRVVIGSAATGQGVVGYDDGHEGQKGILRLVLDHAEAIDIDRMKAARDGKKSTG